MSGNEYLDDDSLQNGKEQRKKAISLYNPNVPGSSRTQVLCSICKGLNLSADKFIINHDSSVASKNILNPFLPQPHPTRISDFPLRSKSSKKHLGTLSRILGESATCPLCSLIINSITNPDRAAHIKEPLSYPEASCFVNWEIDGRKTVRGDEGSLKGRTRRLHLSWTDSNLADSYLVFVAPETYIRPNSDALCVWRDEALFLGRIIDTEGGSRALIKSWLDLCCKSHRGPCTDSRVVWRHSEFGHMISQSYFGVIDVYNMRLTSLPYQASGELSREELEKISPHLISKLSEDSERRPGSPGGARSLITYDPYVALSHVWGEQRSCVTTLENIMLHRSHGGLERILAALPTSHAFRDAIDVVRGLGIQYLWIDSLCIIQDSTRSWNLNSRVMDLIYGHAKLTICAADGSDSSAGLRAMHAREHDHHQYMRECVPGVRLMVSRPPEAGIKASTWDKRAWTFQERLLSPRCLIYTEGRVYFQCLSTGMSEDIFADKQGAGWSLDLVQAPLQMLGDLARRAPWVYVNFVSLYTSRNLTKPRDILAAFNGVSNLMRKALGAPFIFGLPSSHFDLALLWEPEKALKRRRPRKNDEKGKAEFNGLEFPSWSWCGWWGGKMEYKSDMVEGCLMDLNEWLIKHTWIHWYIRDGHGNLRPLWDGDKFSKGVTLEKRWMSYGGKPDDDVVEPTEDMVRSRSRSRRRERSVSYSTGDVHARHIPQEEALIDYGMDPMNKIRKAAGRIEPSEYSMPQTTSVRSVSAQAPPRHKYRLYENNMPHYYASRVVDQRGLPSGLVSTSKELEANEYRRRDTYGRDIPMEIADHQDHFQQTLPESPYRVVMTKYSSEPDKEFPDQPILQFWTWHTTLHLAPSDDDDDPSSPGRSGSGLRRYDIADQVGDWCGSLVLDEQWIRASQSSRHEFIAISEAKAFTRDECDVWTYYTPKERDQSEWDLYFVLLVERKGVKWERVALGKVFKAAFANSEWKEIILG